MGGARFEFVPTYHPGGKVGKSKTIASFDVGLANERDALRYQQSPEETRRRLLSILRVFYGGWDDLGNATRSVSEIDCPLAVEGRYYWTCEAGFFILGW